MAAGLALVLAVSGIAVGTPVVDGPLAARADAFLRGQVAEGLHGSVLVALDGRVVLHQGYGWSDDLRRRPIGPETPFWIASIAKQFTAAALLDLAQRGRVRLDDPITRYFPDVPPDKASITLHQLLTHTAGLAQRYAADGIGDRRAAVAAILRPPLANAPGVRFQYSNDAYNLLAAVVEIASGTPYERHLARRLFRPAGLRHTGFWGSRGQDAVAEIRRDVDPAVRGPNWGFRGATGISSTVGDLYRWWRALEDGRVLREEHRRLLVAPHVSIEGGHAGYGWFRGTSPHGRPTLWTRGTEGFGHNAIVVVYPEQRAVVVAASNAGALERDLPTPSRRVAAALEVVLLGPSP